MEGPRPGFPRQYGPDRLDHQPGIPLFPQEATRDLVTIFLLVAMMFFLSAFVTPFLGPARSPQLSELIVPDWYLLFSWGLLKVADIFPQLTIGAGTPVKTEFSAAFWGPPERHPGDLPARPALHRPRPREPSREGPVPVRLRDCLPDRLDLHVLPVLDPRGRRTAVDRAEWDRADPRRHDEVVLRDPAGPRRLDVVPGPPAPRLRADAAVPRPVRPDPDRDRRRAGRGDRREPGGPRSRPGVLPRDPDRPRDRRRTDRPHRVLPLPRSRVDSPQGVHVGRGVGPPRLHGLLRRGRVPGSADRPRLGPVGPVAEHEHLGLHADLRDRDRLARDAAALQHVRVPAQ